MDILIVGPSGSGKSKLGDLIKNTVFKLDREAHVHTDDQDREVKDFGGGKNLYNIKVRQVHPSLSLSSTITQEDLKRDMIVILTNDSVAKWFKEVFES